MPAQGEPPSSLEIMHHRTSMSTCNIEAQHNHAKRFKAVAEKVIKDYRKTTAVRIDGTSVSAISDITAILQHSDMEELRLGPLIKNHHHVGFRVLPLKLGSRDLSRQDVKRDK